MSTDVLSEVLRAVRLNGAVFFTIEAAPPWVAEAPAAGQVAQQVLPGSEHVIEYHVVTRGSCYGTLHGGEPVPLATGDVIVFPHGDAHVMSSQPGLRGQFDTSLFRLPERGQLPIAVSLNASCPTSAEVVCGFLGLDARPYNPLLSALPRVIHVPKRATSGAALVERLIEVAVHESSTRRPGSESMLARLSELFFIEMVRHYLASLPSGTTGWLAGLRDDVIGRALAVLHDRPAATWTLEDLAKEVGISRSVLAERFHHYVGTPPMQYLARWRMQLAAGLLSGTNVTLAEVAERVGYGSEAALSRAFKRLVGVAPSAWRDGARPDPGYEASNDLGSTADDAGATDPV